MKKIILFVVVLMLISFFSGCTEESNDLAIQYKNNRIRFDNSEVMQISFKENGSYVTKFYDFTDEGLRSSLDDVDGKSFVFFDFPNGTMNVSGMHKNNASFYVNGSYLFFNGMGENNVDPNNSSRFIRSKLDTIFVVENISSNQSVFCFSGNNLTISGLNITFNDDYNIFPIKFDNVCEWCKISDIMVYKKCDKREI